MRGQLRSRDDGLGGEAAQYEGGHPGQRHAVVVDVDPDAGSPRRREAAAGLDHSWSERPTSVTAIGGNRADQQPWPGDAGLIVATTERNDPVVSFLIRVAP